MTPRDLIKHATVAHVTVSDLHASWYVSHYAVLIMLELMNPHFWKGFGTSPFSHYSYALVGEKAIKNWPKLGKNITCCATMS